MIIEWRMKHPLGRWYREDNGVRKRLIKNNSVAHLAEHLTLNQRVQGSSPCGVTVVK